VEIENALMVAMKYGGPARTPPLSLPVETKVKKCRVVFERFLYNLLQLDVDHALITRAARRTANWDDGSSFSHDDNTHEDAEWAVITMLGQSDEDDEIA